MSWRCCWASVSNGLALGYEDLNDHEQLRHHPLLAVMAGQKELDRSLAGKSTLNRMELTPGEGAEEQRYHRISYSRELLDQLLVDIFLEAHPRAPHSIVLDLDVTDIPLQVGSGLMTHVWGTKPGHRQSSIEGALTDEWLPVPGLSQHLAADSPPLLVLIHQCLP